MNNRRSAIDDTQVTLLDIIVKIPHRIRLHLAICSFILHLEDVCILVNESCLNLQWCVRDDAIKNSLEGGKLCMMVKRRDQG